MLIPKTALVTFVFIAILLLNFSIPTFAFEHTLITKQELKSSGFGEYESINPNLLIFPLKRISETIGLKLTFYEKSKIQYQYGLLDKRYKELVFIINFQKTGFLRESVDRYDSLLGKLILNHKNEAPKEKLLIYINVLKNLQDRYNNESAYRLLIQEAIDSTKRLI